MRILLVEDNAAMAASIEMTLRAEKYVVETASCGEDGLALAQRYACDIIILDLILPDMDGFQVLTALRAAGIHTPVLILSGMSDLDYKLKALGLGADDFLAKPFDRRELIARLQAVIRRSKVQLETMVRTGKLVVDLGRHVVEVDGRRLPVTTTEYNILELLSRRKGATIGKEALLNHLYGDVDAPAAKIIDVFVCKLRKKISAATDGADYIATIWGDGYALRDPASEEAAV